MFLENNNNNNNKKIFDIFVFAAHEDSTRKSEEKNIHIRIK